jgi:[ribosomal protein S5]-alanine N-acetyltransferase
MPPMPNRVHIRPVAAGDEAEFVAAALRSRRLHRPWVSAPATAEQFQQYLQRFSADTNRGFVVVVNGADGPALAGVVNLSNIVRGVFRSAYLGYYAFAGFEGRGIMKRGLRATVRHAFGELGLHRLEANIQPGNTPSIALARACGFRLEGYSPAYLKIGGRWRDHERWAIVARRPLS